MQSRLLIVEDDPEMREAIGSLFAHAGHSCILVASAVSALEQIRKQTFDVVVSDVVMTEMTGLELLDRLKVSHPALPVILIAAAGGVSQAVDAIKRGAFGYATKPFDVEELRRVVADALEARQHPHESLRPASPSDAAGGMPMVGAGPAMRKLQSDIDFIARSSAPVMVTGETGVGKELVARAVHAQSARSSGPFVAVNTSAIPHDLLEGEIFGHVRGGFTGAVQSRQGVLTEADGGTILLDEIGDMSFGLQAKLLRVLQFGDVRPVGGDKVHHVDVRIVAATHRDLPTLVNEGRFREDLYFRLNVLSLHVPPLRERREDIPALAVHFLAQALQRAPGSPVRSIGEDALRALSERAWPGNVRELASAIERAVVFGVEEVLDARQLATPPRSAPRLGAGPVTGWPFPEHAPWTLERLSREYAAWVLAQHPGNKRRAAEILGVNLSTLNRWKRQPNDGGA